MSFCVVAASYQWAAFHKIKSFLNPDFFVFRKFVRMYNTNPLPNAFLWVANIALVVTTSHPFSKRIVHNLVDFFIRLTKTNHKSGFRSFSEFFYSFYLLKASCIFCLRTHFSVQSLNGFHIMRYYLLVLRISFFPELPSWLLYPE